MEGIPEEDLRSHEKRLAGKDKDEPDTPDTTKAPPPIGMPPIPPLGMMSSAPMMPMGFPGMPFGITSMPLPMMPVQMMTQMRPPMPMIPPAAAPPKPLFPSGANEVSFSDNKIVLLLMKNLDK
jgi:hypothetical protein